jgi:hypothetical protein
MPFVTKLSLCAVGVTTAALILAISLPVASARADELKHYDSNNKEFWLHPPDDWFVGDETQEQKGTAPANTMGPPTGMTDEEIAGALVDHDHFGMAPAMGSVAGHEVARFEHDLDLRIHEDAPASLEDDQVIINHENAGHSRAGGAFRQANAACRILNYF